MFTSLASGFSSAEITPFACALGVTELTRYLAELFHGDELAQDVWVRGEVSSVTYHSSGHVYFSLKDEESCLKCVAWRSDARRLPFTLEVGMAILAHGRVTIYEKRGEYQLIVDAAEPGGIGSLYLAFEQLRERLQQEGLFDVARKRPVPVFARRIAVVTSPTGAAIQDICSIVRRRCPVTSIVVVPALVQGEGAPESLCEALARAAAVPGIEVVVLARGGGSIEDLWPFNSEALARAIAGCPVPVVSAIGHETDFTIADFVADLRAPTPSAAAELLAPDLSVFQARLAAARLRLIESTLGRLARSRERLEQVRSRRAMAHPADEIARRQQRLDDVSDRLQRAVERAIERSSLGLRGACGRLEALSPLAVLSRGYALTLRLPERSVVGSARTVAPGDRVAIRWNDGEATAQVEKVAVARTAAAENRQNVE